MRWSCQIVLNLLYTLIRIFLCVIHFRPYEMVIRATINIVETRQIIPQRRPSWMIARHLTDGVKQALYTKVIFHIHVTILERMVNLKLKQSKETHKGIQKLRLNDLLIQYSAQNIVHLHFSVPGVCRAIIIPI